MVLKQAQTRNCRILRHSYVSIRLHADPTNMSHVHKRCSLELWDSTYIN
jgi:hypothetical protein